MERSATSGELANMIKNVIKSSTADFKQREKVGIARRDTAVHREERRRTTFSVEGALRRPPREFTALDEHGAERLRRLEAGLAVVQEDFPGMETGVALCRLSCALLEGAWHERAAGPQAPADDGACSCALCAQLPEPLPRGLEDYDWRRSDGRPLRVKTWPERRELDSVLTGGWVWTRKMNDSERDLGLRFRHQDDILVLHEYKRVEAAIEVSESARLVRRGLARDRTSNGARALLCGLYAAHKRSVDEHWLDRHVAGTVALPQRTPLDKPSYSLLQLMDCLFWHVSPDEELWQEEHLAALVLCRVLNDMTDVRADAVTGEASNFWLSSMSTHDKALYGACVLALLKYGCLPESHELRWNSWLMNTTVVWEGLTGRHALWFDGITDGLPAREDCLLCGIEPNACTGLLTEGVGHWRSATSRWWSTSAPRRPRSRRAAAGSSPRSGGSSTVNWPPSRRCTGSGAATSVRSGRSCAAPTSPGPGVSGRRPGCPRGPDGLRGGGCGSVPHPAPAARLQGGHGPALLHVRLRPSALPVERPGLRTVRGRRRLAGRLSPGLRPPGNAQTAVPVDAGAAPVAGPAPRPAAATPPRRAPLSTMPRPPAQEGGRVRTARRGTERWAWSGRCRYRRPRSRTRGRGGSLLCGNHSTPPRPRNSRARSL